MVSFLFILGDRNEYLDNITWSILTLGIYLSFSGYSTAECGEQSLASAIDTAGIPQ
jgi:hypothetical protein